MAKNTSTRSVIVQMLKRQKDLTVTQMAGELGVTEMAVRRHLHALEKDALIEATLVRQPMGRPLSVYRLSEEAEEQFPRNYAGLTLEFMQDFQDIAGNDVVDDLFARRESRLYEQYAPRMAHTTFEDQVAELTAIVNEAGYMAEWEKTDAHYEIKEFNCPIAKVADHYEQACHCELSLFKKLLGTTRVERTECLAKGGSCCKYRIAAE
nr:metalloregulator ArsR/SmtB family transcription factor [Fictibacillus macauensis]